MKRKAAGLPKALFWRLTRRDGYISGGFGGKTRMDAEGADR